MLCVGLYIAGQYALMQGPVGISGKYSTWPGLIVLLAAQFAYLLWGLAGFHLVRGSRLWLGGLVLALALLLAENLLALLVANLFAAGGLA